jgi:hypothetical protein
MAHYSQLITDYYDNLRGRGEEAQNDLKPLYSIDYDNDTQLITWLNQTLSVLQEEAGPRVENQFRNVMFYKGVHSLNTMENLRAIDYDNTPVTAQNRFVMNHILEFTLQKQSRLMRFGPTVNVFPWNNSYADRLGARLGKKIIESAFYIQDFENILSAVALEAAICGESFVFFEWDKFAGDKTKEHIAAEKRKEAVPNLEFTAEDGSKIDLKSIPRVGDHKITQPLPWQVLQEPRAKWKEVKYIFKATIKHIDEIKAENAGLGADTLAKIQGKGTDSKMTEFQFGGNVVIQWEFYHKVDRFVPNGKYAKFFNDVLIEHGDLPYSHGELPCARFTDYDDPVNAHGRSFYESLKLPSVMINNMMKVAYRSYVISAYPKIIMQQDSTNMYSMANGPFVMEYQPGSPAPQIVAFNAVNQDFFPLSQHVERFMEKNSGTFGISRGDQVPNARARSILNFYEEQEQERESTQIRKFSAVIEKSAKLLLANSADYYKPEDDRTIRIVGKHNQYKVVKMSENTKLSGDYNVKIERTTALSESKQGRIDQISTLSQIPISGQDNAGLFTREQILSMLEIGDTSTFFEMATAAVEAASSENEDLFENIEVLEPQEFQMHLIHWNVHFQYIQSREFTDTQGVPEEVRERMLDHLRVHEDMLYQAAKQNLALATSLSQNLYFPSVFKLAQGDLPLSQIVLLLQQPPPPPMPPQMPMEGEGPLPPMTDLPQPEVMPEDVMPSPDQLQPDPAMMASADAMPQA